MAAITACARGHKVVLAERADRVGGNVRLIAQESHKEDIARYLHYLEHKIAGLERAGVLDVRFGCEVDRAFVEEMAPDALIVAVGAEPFVPPVPGVDAPVVMGFAQAIGHVEDLGSRVVVVGGGTIGAELALELAEQGHEVKVVEMGSALAAQGNSLFRIALRQMFDRQGKAIEVLLNTSCTSIGEEGVCVSGPDGGRARARLRQRW